MKCFVKRCKKEVNCYSDEDKLRLFCTEHGKLWKKNKESRKQREQHALDRKLVVWVKKNPEPGPKSSLKEIMNYNPRGGWAPHIAWYGKREKLLRKIGLKEL